MTNKELQKALRELGFTLTRVPGEPERWKLTKEKPITCECTDPRCPVHAGVSKCSKLAEATVRRIDMDSGGIPMCEECAKDAMESGVFD